MAESSGMTLRGKASSAKGAAGTEKVTKTEEESHTMIQPPAPESGKEVPDGNTQELPCPTEIEGEKSDSEREVNVDLSATQQPSSGCASSENTKSPDATATLLLATAARLSLAPTKTPAPSPTVSECTLHTGIERSSTVPSSAGTPNKRTEGEKSEKSPAVSKNSASEITPTVKPVGDNPPLPAIDKPKTTPPSPATSVYSMHTPLAYSSSASCSTGASPSSSDEGAWAKSHRTLGDNASSNITASGNPATLPTGKPVGAKPPPLVQVLPAPPPTLFDIYSVACGRFKSSPTHVNQAAVWRGLEAFVVSEVDRFKGICFETATYNGDYIDGGCARVTVDNVDLGAELKDHLGPSRLIGCYSIPTNTETRLVLHFKKTTMARAFVSPGWSNLEENRCLKHVRIRSASLLPTGIDYEFSESARLNMCNLPPSVTSTHSLVARILQPFAPSTFSRKMNGSWDVSFVDVNEAHLLVKALDKCTLCGTMIRFKNDN